MQMMYFSCRKFPQLKTLHMGQTRGCQCRRYSKPACTGIWKIEEDVWPGAALSGNLPESMTTMVFIGSAAVGSFGNGHRTPVEFF